LNHSVLLANKSLTVSNIIPVH